MRLYHQDRMLRMFLYVAFFNVYDYLKDCNSMQLQGMQVSGRMG